LRRRFEDDIENYRYEYPTDSIGTAWTGERIKAELAALRAAVVDPYWVEVVLRDKPEQIDGKPVLVRRCAVAAEDGRGTVLAFDPVDNEFLPAARHGRALVDFGIRGDSVGCFLSR
jgi:hypothetical protein